MQRSKKVIALAAAAAAIAQVSWFTSRADAADVRWDGGGTDDNLNTPANWVGDANPAVADIARFDAVGATRLTPSTAGGGVQYGTIFFGNLATAAETDAYTIGGANAITLGSTTAGNYLNNDSEALQTINAPVNMIGGAVGSWNASLSFGGLFNVGNGAAASGGNSVTFNTNGNNITLAGGITGAATGANDNARIIKSGAGTLFVTADSAAWLGRVLINTGVLQISNGNALGSGGGSIFTAGNQNTGTLELTGGIALTKTVQTHGREIAAVNSVSLRSVSGNNSVSNVVTSTGGSQYNYESVADNLTINTWNTTGSGGARILRVIGAGNGEIQNWTPVAGNVMAVIKDGAGTWSLRSGMNNANGAFSTVTVNNGTLVFDGGLGSRVIGTATVAPNVTVNNGGTLRVVSTDGTTGEVGTSALNTTLNVKAGGTLDASSFSTYFVQTNQSLVAGGTIQTGGTLRADADAIIRIGDVATPAAGTMTVIGNLGLSNADALPNGGVYFDLSSAATTVGGGVNDLISVQGDLQAINTSGPVNIRINSLGGGFATGTYRLIDFTSGTTPNPADFNLVGFAAGTTRQTAQITSDVNQLNLTIDGSAASLAWKGDGVGNAWDVVGTKNFLNGATDDFFYQFDNVTFDDTTTNTTVNTAAGATLQPGAITANTAQTYTITGGATFAGVIPLTKSGSGTLILANTGGGLLTGGITINEGTLQIGTGGTDGPLWSGPVVNNGTFVINRIDSVTPGLISGSGALVKAGDGDLVLNAAHTYTGATTIHQGRVLANNAGAFGDVATGTTVNPGGQIYFVSPATTYNEPFTVAGDGPAALGALRAGGGALQTLAAPVSFTASTIFNADGGATLNLTNTLTGTGDLTKIGGGTMVVGGAGSTWTGNTNINAGRLEMGAGAVAVDLPAGNINLAAGATLAFGSSQAVTFSRPLIGAGILAQGAGGGTTTVTGDLSGFTGTLSTSQGGVTSTLVIATPTNAATATVSDSSGGNGLGILRLTHSQALPSTATINVQAQQVNGTGWLELGNNVDIAVATININQKNNPTASILSADGNNSINSTINLFTGGNNGALEAAEGATLTVDGTIQPGAGVTTTRNLHLQGAGNGTANATIQNSTGTNLNLHKNGAGTWTLTAANSYTGSTNVNAGTLRVENNLTSSTAANVAGGTLEMASGGGSNRILRAPAVAITGEGRIDLRDNKLITDVPVGSFNGTAYTGIQGEVQRAYNFGAWDTPGLTTSMPNAGFNAGILSGTETIGVATAEQVMFIGATDTGVFQGQTVTGATTIAMYTYAGDLNFDGLVDGADYGVIDNYVQFPGTDGYVNGDFNYDGVIDGADYGVIDNTIQLQGAPFPGVVFGAASQSSGGGLSGVTAVPEPSACGFAILAGAALLRRRRRGLSRTR